MKIARVQASSKVSLGLVDEATQVVDLVGGEWASHPNPVLAVIQQGVTASQLQAAVVARVPIAQVKFLAPLSAFLRNPFAVAKTTMTTHSSLTRVASTPPPVVLRPFRSTRKFSPRPPLP